MRMISTPCDWFKVSVTLAEQTPKSLIWLQVFEKLGLSLYDFLRVNQYRPFRIDVVRDFGRQLLESVAYLHGLQLIHTDLKPENILLAACDDDRKSPTPGIRLEAPLAGSATTCCLALIQSNMM